MRKRDDEIPLAMRFGRRGNWAGVPFLPPRGNRISVSHDWRSCQRSKSYFHSPRVKSPWRSSPFLPRPLFVAGREGEERRIFFFSPRCQSHFVSRHASRTFTPPRIQCDRWNANKKHHTKVATALVDREARASRRVVAPFRQNFLSKFDVKTVPCANTRRRRRSRIDTPTTFPSRSPAKSTRIGRGRRRANTSANALSRFGKLKRKVGVDRSTSNGTFNLLTRGGDYASGSS